MTTMPPATAGTADDAAAAQARERALRLDRTLRAEGARWQGGLSPVALGLAMTDWLLNLGTSPALSCWLATRAHDHGLRAWGRLVQELTGRHTTAAGAASPGSQAAQVTRDPAAWPVPTWPYAAWAHAHLAWADWLREATEVPGMAPHHGRMVDFYGQQWADMLAPANSLLNPAVVQACVDSRGDNLLRGWSHLLQDWRQRQAAGLSMPDSSRLARTPTTALTTVPAARPGNGAAAGRQGPVPEPAASHRPGVDLAITPGAVVYRNALIELIQYAPMTSQVQAEPVFIVPSWIMKYYILDLSPHNSLVRHLVSCGHTVFIVSWRNPDAADAALGMADYLQLGVFDALAAIGRLVPGQGVQAVGYCLGGTLMAIAAAALARPGVVDAASGGAAEPAAAPLPPLRSLTLLAAQVDFTEPGEIGVLIDEAQVEWLQDQMDRQGYLSGRQMASAFQFLHARELVWSRAAREYLLGEREHASDLMAWNADLTRMPAAMHGQYLRQLFLRNDLAEGRYCVDGRPVSLRDLRLPLFVVGTERDHVCPWRSVYKIHRLVEAPVTFLLVSGGHNAGIVSEPGHPHRQYLERTTAPGAGGLPAQDWARAAQQHEGSWWPRWHAWLVEQSGGVVPARRIDAAAAIEPAPGGYVKVRYED